MNIFQISWKNIINKPLNATLSLVLFALGVGLISLLLLLNQQIEEKFDKNLAGIDLVVGAKGSPLQLILSSMYHIDAPTGNISLKSARPFLNPKHPLIGMAIPLSVGDNYKGHRIVGTSPKILELYDSVQIEQGRIWENVFEVVIGKVVAEKLDLQLGSKFYGSHGLIDDLDLAHDDVEAFKVVGILEGNGSVIDQLILTANQTVWAVHDHEMSGSEAESDTTNHEGHAHAMDLSVPLTAYPDKDITSLLIKFKSRNFQTLNMPRSINENTDMQAATPAIEINRIYSMIGDGEEALRYLAFIIIFVSGLSIFISLFSSLRERRYELALMRVMGASPSKLFLLIVLEGIILAFVGYVIGILLSHVGMSIFATQMEETYRYSFSGWEFMKEEGYLLFGALGVGFIAAILPAIQASNTDISTTLSEG